MTLKDIAVFKHFIAEKDLRKPFIRVFLASRDFAKLPTNIEDFFVSVEPLAVILSSMRVCRPNDTFGYNFWQDLHQEWKVYYKKMQSSAAVTDDEGRLLRLEGYYKILRENWNDKDKPWLFEERYTALARLGLPPKALDESAAPHSVLSDSVAEASESPQDVTSDPLADFDFFDVVEVKSTRLQQGEASINFNNGGYKLTFNQFDSQTIIDSQHAFVRLAKSKSGDICLIFNSSAGTRITFASNGRKSSNVTVNSKDITTKLRTLFNIRPDYSILNVSLLPSPSDYVIYKLIKS